MNINTSKFWDKQFKDEYKFYKQKKTLTTTCDWRWNGTKFGNLGSNVGFTGKLLDVGCGLGHFCRYIKARSIDLEVTGMDFSKFSIKKAKGLSDKINMDIDFVVGDAQELPFEDNSFNYVVSSDVIEHLDDPDKHLMEIKRVLKKGGIAIVLTPWKNLINKEGLISEEHVQEWTPDELSVLMTKYFGGGRVSLPPVMLDIITKKITYKYWFTAISIK